MHGWFNSQLVNLIGVRATVTQLAGWLVGWWGTWLVGGWVNELEGWWVLGWLVGWLVGSIASWLGCE